MVSPQLVTQPGDFIWWTIPVKNSGNVTDPSVQVSVTLPAGVQLTGFNTTKGTFNVNTGVWTVGSLMPAEQRQLVLTFKVLDVSVAPYSFVAVAAGSNIDPNVANNTLTDIVNLTTCPPSAGAVDDPFACLCGSVATNDTACSHCTTRYELDVTSLVNLVVNSFDAATGAYSVTKGDPTLVSSFEYSIWCDCPGGASYETSGPALVTIQPLFTALPAVPIIAATDPCCNNGVVEYYAPGRVEVTEEAAGEYRVNLLNPYSGSANAAIAFSRTGGVYPIPFGSIPPIPAVTEDLNGPDGGHAVYVTITTPYGAPFLKHLLRTDSGDLQDAAGAAISNDPQDPSVIAITPMLSFGLCPVTIGDLSFDITYGPGADEVQLFIDGQLHGVVDTLVIDGTASTVTFPGAWTFSGSLKHVKVVLVSSGDPVVEWGAIIHPTCPLT